MDYRCGVGTRTHECQAEVPGRENQIPYLVMLLFPHQMASVFLQFFGTGRIFELWNPVASKNGFHFSIFASLEWPYLQFPCIRIAQSHFFQFGGWGLIITYFLITGVNDPIPYGGVPVASAANMPGPGSSSESRSKAWPDKAGSWACSAIGT